MQISLLDHIICPLSGSQLSVCIISIESDNQIMQGVLCGENGTVYPIIDGVPRLIPEAIFDYGNFLSKHIPNFVEVKEHIVNQFGDQIKVAIKRTRRTKQSFTVEWEIYDYESDKTWHLDHGQMVQQFLDEANITEAYLKNKVIADLGCGNGVLTQYMAKMGAVAIGMDLSLSIQRGAKNALHSNVHFIQGDLHYPPLKAESFDHLHSSGVLHHTPSTRNALEAILPLARNPKKISIWLYHPINENGHKFMMWLRTWTVKLPSRFQYWLYYFTLLPLTLISRRMKGNYVSSREIMVDLMDFFSPEFRWEHEEEEVLRWYDELGIGEAEVTTRNRWGYSVSNVKG